MADYPSRSSPDMGLSTARTAMVDAARFYLANGGPAVARQQVERLANVLKFYADCSEAYCEAMAIIRDEEDLRRQQREDHQLRQTQRMVESVIVRLHSNRRGAAPEDAAAPAQLPERLSTPKAMELWKRLQQAGYIDKNYQPIKLSRTKMAVIADELAMALSSENDRLTGIDDKWKPFETLWKLKNLRGDQYRSLSQKSTNEFRIKIHQLLSGD